MSDYLIFVVGIVFAGAGGELFVRGTVGLARWARVSPGIVAATVAAFATSAPELAVSVTAAAKGVPRIALGDALGSNVVNVALIFGVVLLISRVQVPVGASVRDYCAALSVPAVTAILVFDGVLSRIDGLSLLTLFIVWLTAVTVEARRQRSTAIDDVAERRGWRAAVLCLTGLACLVVAGRAIVAGASGIAASFGIDDFVIAATVIAVGTSVPEIATAVVAKLRGHDEVSVGTILGSNIFNGLLIVGVASMISPIAVDRYAVRIALAFGFLAVAFALPVPDGSLGRARGVLLLVLYGAYVAIFAGYVE